LAAQQEIAEKAAALLEQSPAKGRGYLTEQTQQACNEATQAYWNLGDLLWTKYDEQW
jgi:hypothetical protein